MFAPKTCAAGAPSGACRGVGDVDGGRAERPALGADREDRAVRRGHDLAGEHVVTPRCRSFGPVDGRTADGATGRERHHARFVRERLARNDRRRLVYGHILGRDDAGPSPDAVALDQLAELGEHRLTLTALGAQHVVEIRDRASKFVALLFELELFELSEPPQLHVEDRRRLDLAELQLGHQACARLVTVLGTANDLDDGVDGIERLEQTIDDVDAIVGFAQAKLCALDDDVETMLDVVAAQIVETEGGGHAVDEHHVVDAERVFHRRSPVEVGQHRMRIDRWLARDLDAQPVLAIAEIDDVVDAADLVVDHQLLDATDDPLRADHERQLGDDDALAPATLEVDDLCLGSCANCAATGLVGLAEALVDHDAASREVGPRQHRQQFVEGRSGAALGEHQLDRFVHLAQVVRRHVGRHADGDAGGAIDQQIGQHRGETHGLGLVAVVARPELDRFFVEFVDHVHRGGGQLALGITMRRRWIVERAEVALWIDERHVAGKWLRHAYERLVDRHVTVRVITAHDLTDDLRALDAGSVGAQPHVVHAVQDAALHRFETVADVGDGARSDDRQRILEERLARSRLRRRHRRRLRANGKAWVVVAWTDRLRIRRGGTLVRC